MKEVLLKSAKLLGEWSKMKWTDLYSSCCKSHLQKFIIHTSIVFVLCIAHRYHIIPSNATDDQTPHPHPNSSPTRLALHLIALATPGAQSPIRHNVFRCTLLLTILFLLNPVAHLTA